LRKAAENGITHACLQLAGDMYMNQTHAREVGHAEEAAGVAASAGVTEVHDVPPDVLTGVLHWLQLGCVTGQPSALEKLTDFRREAMEGYMYCNVETCKVVGFLKDFKVCPQCRTARYCGAACQKEDWTAGGHKEKCGKVGAQARN
jgi:hypothetical protein